MFCTVLLNIHTGRTFLATHIHIFTFTVWILVGWEVGRRKVIFTPESLMLKIAWRDT